MKMRLNRWRERFGRCQECGRWRWDLEEDEVVTDYPEPHSTAWWKSISDVIAPPVEPEPSRELVAAGEWSVDDVPFD